MSKITATVAAALAATTFAIATPAVAFATADNGSRTTVSSTAAGPKGPARAGTGSAAPTPRPAGATSKIGSLNSKLAGLGIPLP